jgi:hypothetical protein
MGDTNGDGVPDLITGAGPGGAPHVVVIDGATGASRLSFFAFELGLSVGVEVASGDVNGDGDADIVVSTRPFSGPRVRVFDGRRGTLLRDFFAADPAFAGGVHVAVGDVNGDGFGDIVTGLGYGAAPLVRVFDGSSGAVLREFEAYASGFRGGVYVAAGDVTGDGFADIVTGAGAGGGPHVRVFDGVTSAQVSGPLGSFFAYSPAFPGGVRVAAGDFDGDGRAEVVTGAGPGGGPHVRVFDGATGAEVAGFFAFDPAYSGGVYVAAPPPLARMVVDAPAPGPTGSNSITVVGWTLKEDSTGGSNVDAIHVWAYPVAGGAPIFVGAASGGDSRLDVASFYGGEFGGSGFHVTGTLPPGTYDLVVFSRSAATRLFDNRRIVRIVVP